MSKFTFGSDPEFMLVNKQGQYRSAITVLEKNNDNPHKINGYEYYYDNILAECTIKPAKNKEEALNNVKKCLSQFAKLVHPHKLVAQASQEFPKKELDHPDAVRVGCRPEICAYALKQIHPPEEEFLTKPLRTAGGHVHIGHEFAQSDLGCIMTIKMCDLFLGVPSIFIDHDPTSQRRKGLYGRAGRFRKPDYGAEYRSMGNFWLTSPKLTGLVYDICDFIVDFLEKGKHNDFWSVDMDRLKKGWAEPDFDQAKCHKCKGYNVNAMRDAIDSMDKKKGEPFMKLIHDLLPANINDQIAALSDEKEFDMYKEWQLI